jgi:cysteine dioxygenase
MATQPCIDKLELLCAFLDGLTERATIKALHHKLKALDVAFDDVAEFAQFSEDTYVRNLIRTGPWYHLLALCWRSGQRSPIHNHAGSTCGLKILKGVATETVFKSSPSSLMYPARSHDMQTNEIAVAQDSDVHQVSNLQTPGEDLVTLHIYSPPLLRMDTYSLTDRTVGEFRPVFFEHDSGSGI